MTASAARALFRDDNLRNEYDKAARREVRCSNFQGCRCLAISTETAKGRSNQMSSGPRCRSAGASFTRIVTTHRSRIERSVFEDA